MWLVWNPVMYSRMIFLQWPGYIIPVFSNMVTVRHKSNKVWLVWCWVLSALINHLLHGSRKAENLVQTA